MSSYDCNAEIFINELQTYCNIHTNIPIRTNCCLGASEWSFAMAMGKTYKLALMFLGVPITWAFMEATRYAVSGFGGQFWPGRFTSFVAGIIVFTVMTYVFKEEAVNLKTGVSLLLALSLILVQLFWK